MNIKSRKLSKKLLLKEYFVNKLTSYKIAKRFGVSSTWINILRKRYGIPTIKSYERASKQFLSKTQEEYIYGNLIGDGCLKKGSENAYFSVGQTNFPYVKEQYDIIKDFVKIKIKSYRKKGRKSIYHFRTISHPTFTKIYNMIYLNGVKKITKKWLTKLTPYSLSFWYMDDGSLTKSNRQMRISTESFSYKEQLLLQQFLFQKFDIKTTIKKSSAVGKFLLYFNAKNRDRFFLLISPYIIKSMNYKICKPENWKKWESDDIKYLKNNYFGRKSNWKSLLYKLDRSKFSISRKASYLKLTRR